MKTNFDSNNLSTIAQQFEYDLSTKQPRFIDKSVLEELIYFYLDKDNLELAEKACDLGQDFFPYSSEFPRLKAQVFLENNRFDDAFHFIEKAIQCDGNSVENFVVKVEAYIRSNQLSMAEALLKHAQARFGPDSREILLCRLSYYERNNDYFKAFLILKEYLLANSYEEKLLTRIHFYTEMAECYSESIILHNYITNNDPYSHLAWHNLGSCYFNLKQYDAAVEAYEFAMVICPTFKMAFLDCAEAYFQVGMYEKSIETFGEYLEHFELSTDVAVLLGACCEGIEDFDKALQFYLEALKLDPYNDKAHHQLGLFYQEQNKWVAARDSIQRAIELNPSESDYYASFGMVHFNLEEFDLAQNYLEKACDLAPDECSKWIQYAVFLLEIDDANGALEVIDQAFLYCTTPKKLNFCKAACLFTLGRRKEAFMLLNEALSQSKENVELLYQCQPFLKEDAEVVTVIQEFV